jgi:lambda family phage portal protein
MNTLDRIIAYFNPDKAFKRERMRIALDAARQYEGASKGRRLQNWKARSTDQNAETLQLQVLRDRSRDLVRNNAWAARACQVIVNNTVGTGILPQAQGAQKKRKQQLWERWGDTTECDADGRHNFYGLESLVMDTVVESGECLIRRRIRRESDGYVLPFQVQVLEPDYLDQTKTGPTRNGGYMVQGIQFNAVGKREGYWLYQEHPGSTLGLRNASTFVPADSVIHVYRMERPGQARGVPWVAPVMVRLRDLADWQDNKLLRAKLAACFTAFVTDADPTGEDLSGDLISSLEPGLIEYLPPGKGIEFASPPTVGGEESYVADELRAIASGFGITYEALTQNLSNVNFSSGRMGWIEMHRNIESWRWNMLIPQFCDRVWQWFEASAEFSYQLPYGSVIWTPPRREMLDPVKEFNALEKQVRNGFISHSEALRMLGYDPDVVLKELADDFKRFDKLGLVLDVDPRQEKSIGQSEKVDIEVSED